jgi:predicted ATPase
MLLVLDNVEHVIDAAPDVSALVTSCPSVKILTTSREPLGVRWEHEFPIAPLRVACVDGLLTPEALSEVPSVALFVERAQAIRPGFTLTEDNAAAIGRICRRLDGLPLALEMAAARLRSASPALLWAHLERRTDLLGARVPDAPARHQTLGDLIGWSYDLLTPDDQSLLRRMAVFAHGCTREAAEALTGGDPCRVALLVEKNLAVTVDGVAGENRIALLETVQSFALERLREHGEEDAARDGHSAHVVQFVEAIVGRVQRNENRAYWLARLAADEDNVQSAIRWLVRRKDVDRATRLRAAVTMAAGEAGQPAMVSTSEAADALLTAREREIAQWIAKGLTSRKIARALHISEKTVDSHADHIRTKLNLGSRAEIAAWAVAQGLHTPRPPARRRDQ